MLMGSKDTEKLYAKALCIKIKDGHTNQLRTEKLFLTVEWQPVSTAIHKQELAVYLTDGNDPFFLYTSNLSEEDFYSLQQQQGLLVDFLAFPQKFIELLELCLLEENKTHPKYLLVLNIQSKTGATSATAQLDIVETNPFKHLTHLSLKLIAASDSTVKQYFAVCFKKLKDEKEQLENKLNYVETDFKKQMLTWQETLSSKTQELEHFQKVSSGELSVKETKYKEELLQERDKLLKIQRDNEERWTKEKEEMEEKHQKRIQKHETRISCLDSLNKELQSKNRKAENSLKELKEKLFSLENEKEQLTNFYENFKKQNTLLEAQLEGKKSMLNKLNAQITYLEKDLSNKNGITSDQMKQIEAAMGEKKILEHELQKMHNLIEEKDATRKKQSEDIEKVNNLVIKLQEQSRRTHSKLRSTGETALKQEKIIIQKKACIERLNKRLSVAEKTVNEKEQQINNLKDLTEALQDKVMKVGNEVDIKENLIRFLNRQIMESRNISALNPTSNMINSTQHPVGSFAASRLIGAHNDLQNNEPCSRSGALTTPVQQNISSNQNYGPSSADRMAFQNVTSRISPSTAPKVQPTNDSPLDMRYLQKDYNVPLSSQRKLRNTKSDRPLNSKTANTTPQVPVLSTKI